MTTDDQTHFAANLRRLKESSGMTWLEIGHALGHVNDHYVLELVKGDFEPRVATVNRLAAIFGVEPDEMLRGS